MRALCAAVACDLGDLVGGNYGLYLDLFRRTLTELLCNPPLNQYQSLKDIFAHIRDLKFQERIRCVRNRKKPAVNRQAFLFCLFIKVVISDGEGKGAILGDPVACRDPGVHKEEDLIRDTIAVKADLGGDDRGCRRSLIDRSDGYGGELRAALAVEDHAVDRVGILAACHAVEDHVAHCDLTVQALAARLGGNDTREPIKIVGIIVGRAALQGLARGAKLDGSGVVIPRKIHAECLGKGANG